MSVSPALHAILTADAGVSALVAARVRPHMAWAEDDLPYVVYARISDVVGYHMGGEDGLYDARYQLDCWAATGEDAEALAEAVQSALSNYRGTAGPAGSQSHIRCVQMLSCSNDVQQKPTGSDEFLHRVMMDFRICYQDAD